MTSPSVDLTVAVAGQIERDVAYRAGAKSRDRRHFLTWLVNLHTSEFPGGAVRDQLHQPKKR